MTVAVRPPRRLSVIIPTLSEEATIRGAVRSAFAAGAHEVIVSDGGSRDRTVELAAAAGANVTTGSPGRGTQLNAGVEHASGDALLFLHADARLASGSGAAVLQVFADPAAVGGNFRVRFGDTLHSRFLASFYHVIRQFTICYGDSAIFCRHDAFERVGGFPPYPIMEDITFVRRLRRLGRFAYLDGPVRASPRRWEHGGIAQAWASWAVIHALYELRVPPARLGALYRHIR